MTQRPAPKPWFFDIWSRFYDEAIVQWLAYRPVQDAVMRELRRSSQGRVLDVGCGTGLLASRIAAELAPGHAARVVGCDFSHGMLSEAARRSRGPAWVRGNALRLPFRDASFDAVVSTEAFHWFPDQDRALAELYRVLEPKGRLLLALMSPRAGWIADAARLGSRLIGEPANWPTRGRLRARAEAAGFAVDGQREIFRLPAPLLLPCVLTAATRPG